MDIPVEDVAILFALRQEARAFLRRLPVPDHVAAAPCRTHLCRGSRTSILVMETGVGRERMNRALDWLFGKPYTPKIVISAGFSGALCEDLCVGDIIMGTEVVGADDGCHAASWSQLGAAAERRDYRRGRLLTVDRLIADPAEKRALALQHNAIAVDMETVVIGRRCMQMGIPFACLRAISDDAHAPLSPELEYIVDNGRLLLRRLAGSLLRRPAVAAELWRLARNTRIAAERLGAALHDLLESGGA